MNTGYLVSIQPHTQNTAIGHKAENLQRLLKHGFRIPATWVITWDAHDAYLQDQTDLLTALHQELEQHLLADRHYVVRSSANLEDKPGLSFAGQFKSILDLCGSDQILQAIWSVWAHAHSERVQAYLADAPIRLDELKMAVILQPMVTPVFSGVAFSKNPVTGAAEVIIEAVAGRGTQLVQDGITPHRWVMPPFGNPAALDAEPLPQDLLVELHRQVNQISQVFQQDVDLEWVYDGSQLYWLQMRALAPIQKPRLYSNHISREMLPGLIKPLVWSISVPLNSGEWARILKEMTGLKQLDETGLVRQFYYRAYFDVTTFEDVFVSLGMPPDALERMMAYRTRSAEKSRMKITPQMMRRAPHLLVFMLKALRTTSRLEKTLPGFFQQLDTFRQEPLAQLSEAQLLENTHNLYPLCQQICRFNLFVPIQMGMYNMVLKQRLKAVGVDFESFDLLEGSPEFQELDPAVHLTHLRHTFLELDAPVRERVRQLSYHELEQLPELAAFRQQVDAFLDQFGHLSDSGNDFSVPPWREDPDMILKLIVDFIPTADERAENDNPKIRLADLPAHGINRAVLRFYTVRSRRFRLYREQVSSLYTRSMSLFRAHFLELGRRFAGRGWLTAAEDIFFLYAAEVQSVVSGALPAAECLRLIGERRAEMARYADITMPDEIYGETAPPLADADDRELRGMPSSRGYYQGPARVLRGLADFPKVQPGDVLVIPFSDVGWTPVFSRAGAVVAESGGLLSHSSIIAREFGIPAVVSVPGVMRLQDGTLLTVDGYTGQVLVQKNDHHSTKELP